MVNKACSAKLAIIYLIYNKCEWNIYFIKFYQNNTWEKQLFPAKSKSSLAKLEQIISHKDWFGVWADKQSCVNQSEH